MEFRGRLFVFAALIGLVLVSSVLAQPDGSRAAYASAAALQEQGLFDLAADAWREMLVQSPDGELAPRVRYNLGVCRFHGGAFAESAELFATVADAEQFPKLAEAAFANMGLARLNAARGLLADPGHDPKQVEADLRGAVEAFDRGVAAFPKGTQVIANRFYRGETLTLLGDHQAAAESFRAVLAAQDGESFRRQARIGLASSLLEAGQADQVADAVGELVDDSAAPLLAAEARLLRGEARQQLEEFTAAAKDFAVASTVDAFPDAAYAGERSALCHYLAGDYAAAAGAYDQLVERFPESPLAAAGRVSAGKCWLLAKDAEQAFERLSAAWALSPTTDNVEAARWQGRAALQLGRPGDALAAAQAAMALRPASVAPLRLLAADALLAMEGRRSEAANAYEQFAKSWPDDPAAPRAKLAAATAALELKQFERAQRLAREFAKSYPDDAAAIDAHSVLAAASLSGGKTEQAAREYDGLVNDAPDDSRAAGWLLQAARARRGQGQSAEAIATLTRLIDQYPNDTLGPRALYERGRLRTNASALPAANGDFEAAIAGSADASLTAYARLGLATNQYAAGDADACRVTVQALLGDGPTEVDGQARYLLATAQHATGRHELALESLVNAEASPEALLKLQALCLIGVEKVKDASGLVNDFVERFAANPAGGELLHELAWLYRDQGMSDEALAAFGRVVASYPESALAAESSFRAGEIHSEAERYAEAAAAYGAAAKLAKEAAAADQGLIEQSLHLKGWSHWNGGDRRQAAAAFQQQLDAAPAGEFAADGWLMLGESLFAQKKYGDALPVYEKGLASDDGNRGLLPLALLHAGQSAGQLGDWEASLKLLERSRRWVKDTPLADEASYERAWALHQLERSDEAAPEFARLADAATGVIAARAAFMRGELHFAAKEHQKAVRMFFRVAYGFGGRDAPAEYHTWQAESLFEAARCLEQLNRVDPALKLYAELVERFPESPKAKLAKDRLSAAG